ncbi:MAG: hypothetical protein ACRBF0_06335 [Calditrichia bacterium]
MKTGVLTLIFAIVVIGLILTRFGTVEEQHLVVATKTTEAEAIEFAKELRKGKYASEVYLNKRDLYIVTLGKFPASEISQVKEKAIRQGYADLNATPNDGDSFKTRIFPEDQKEVFLVTFESPVQQRAIDEAKKLRQNYSNSKVYQKPDGTYAVTIGKFPKDQADILAEKFDKESYETDGKDLYTLIYPRPEDNYYVVVKRFQRKNDGLKWARTLRDSTAYDTRMYFTTLGEYVVTIGYAGESQAKRLQQRAIESGLANRDSYLATEDDLGGRVNLDSGEVISFVDDTADKVEEPVGVVSPIKPVVGNRKKVFPGDPRPIEERTGAAPQRDPELLNPDLLKDAPVNAPTKSPSAPASKPVVKEKPVSVNSDFYIVAITSSSMEEALQLTKIYREEGFEGQLFSTKSGKYSVTLGHYPQAKAERMRQLAISSGSAKEDAYLASGSEFKGRIYP